MMSMSAQWKGLIIALLPIAGQACKCFQVSGVEHCENDCSSSSVDWCQKECTTVGSKKTRYNPNNNNWWPAPAPAPAPTPATPGSSPVPAPTPDKAAVLEVYGSLDCSGGVIATEDATATQLTNGICEPADCGNDCKEDYRTQYWGCAPTAGALRYKLYPATATNCNANINAACNVDVNKPQSIPPTNCYIDAAEDVCTPIATYLYDGTSYPVAVKAKLNGICGTYVPGSVPPPGSQGGGGGGDPCFAKERTAACKILSSAVGPAEAYRQCYTEAEGHDAARVLMAGLAVGDKVLTATTGGDLATTRVVVNHHATADHTAKMLTLTTADGAKLSLTPDHAIFVDGALAAASEAKVGSTLSRADGTAVKITRVAEADAAPVITPVTTSGTILAADIDSRAAPVLAASHLMIFAPLYKYAASRAVVSAALYVVGDVTNWTEFAATLFAKIGATLAVAAVAVKVLHLPRGWAVAK